MMLPEWCTGTTAGFSKPQDKFKAIRKLTLDVRLLEEYCDLIAANPGLLPNHDTPTLDIIIPRCLETACVWTLTAAKLS